MIKGLESLIKYFPRNVLEELSKDLKGKKFRLHLVNKKTARDLYIICSEREIIRLDKNNREVFSLKDLESTVYCGRLELGDYYVKSIVSNPSSFKGELIDYERVNPLIGYENVILLKKGVVSDLSKNYFNHNFVNVYAIVS